MPINLQPIFRNPSRPKAYLYSLLFVVVVIIGIGIVGLGVGLLIGTISHFFRGIPSWSNETKIAVGTVIFCWWLLHALSTIGSKLSSISTTLNEAKNINREIDRGLDRVANALYDVRNELDRLEKQLRKMNNDDDFDIPF